MPDTDGKHVHQNTLENHVRAKQGVINSLEGYGSEISVHHPADDDGASTDDDVDDDKCDVLATVLPDEIGEDIYQQARRRSFSSRLIQPLFYEEPACQRQMAEAAMPSQEEVPRSLKNQGVKPVDFSNEALATYPIHPDALTEKTGPSFPVICSPVDDDGDRRSRGNGRGESVKIYEGKYAKYLQAALPHGAFPQNRVSRNENETSDPESRKEEHPPTSTSSPVHFYQDAQDDMQDSPKLSEGFAPSSSPYNPEAIMKLLEKQRESSNWILYKDGECYRAPYPPSVSLHMPENSECCGSKAASRPKSDDCPTSDVRNPTSEIPPMSFVSPTPDIRPTPYVLPASGDPPTSCVDPKDIASSSAALLCPSSPECFDSVVSKKTLRPPACNIPFLDRLDTKAFLVVPEKPLPPDMDLRYGFMICERPVLVPKAEEKPVEEQDAGKRKSNVDGTPAKQLPKDSCKELQRQCQESQGKEIKREEQKENAKNTDAQPATQGAPSRYTKPGTAAACKVRGPKSSKEPELSKADVSMKQAVPEAGGDVSECTTENKVLPVDYKAEQRVPAASTEMKIGEGDANLPYSGNVEDDAQFKKDVGTFIIKSTDSHRKLQITVQPLEEERTSGRVNLLKDESPPSDEFGDEDDLSPPSGTEGEQDQKSMAKVPRKKSPRNPDQDRKPEPKVKRLCNSEVGESNQLPTTLSKKPICSRFPLLWKADELLDSNLQKSPDGKPNDHTYGPEFVTASLPQTHPDEKYLLQNVEEMMNFEGGEGQYKYLPAGRDRKKGKDALETSDLHWSPGDVEPVQRSRHWDEGNRKWEELNGDSLPLDDKDGPECLNTPGQVSEQGRSRFGDNVSGVSEDCVKVFAGNLVQPVKQTVGIPQRHRQDDGAQPPTMEPGSSSIRRLDGSMPDRQTYVVQSGEDVGNIPDPSMYTHLDRTMNTRPVAGAGGSSTEYPGLFPNDSWFQSKGGPFYFEDGCFSKTQKRWSQTTADGIPRGTAPADTALDGFLYHMGCWACEHPRFAWTTVGLVLGAMLYIIYRLATSDSTCTQPPSCVESPPKKEQEDGKKDDGVPAKKEEPVKEKQRLRCQWTLSDDGANMDLLCDVVPSGSEGKCLPMQTPSLDRLTNATQMLLATQPINVPQPTKTAQAAEAQSIDCQAPPCTQTSQPPKQTVPWKMSCPFCEVDCRSSLGSLVFSQAQNNVVQCRWCGSRCRMPPEELKNACAFFREAGSATAARELSECLICRRDRVFKFGEGCNRCIPWCFSTRITQKPVPFNAYLNHPCRTPKQPSRMEDLLKCVTASPSNLSKFRAIMSWKRIFTEQGSRKEETMRKAWCTVKQCSSLSVLTDCDQTDDALDTECEGTRASMVESSRMYFSKKGKRNKVGKKQSWVKTLSELNELPFGLDTLDDDVSGERKAEESCERPRVDGDGKFLDLFRDRPAKQKKRKMKEERTGNSFEDKKQSKMLQRDRSFWRNPVYFKKTEIAADNFPDKDSLEDISEIKSLERRRETSESDENLPEKICLKPPMKRTHAHRRAEGRIQRSRDDTDESPCPGRTLECQQGDVERIVTRTDLEEKGYSRRIESSFPESKRSTSVERKMSEDESPSFQEKLMKPMENKSEGRTSHVSKVSTFNGDQFLHKPKERKSDRNRRGNPNSEIPKVGDSLFSRQQKEREEDLPISPEEQKEKKNRKEGQWINGKPKDRRVTRKKSPLTHEEMYAKDREEERKYRGREVVRTDSLVSENERLRGMKSHFLQRGKLERLSSPIRYPEPEVQHDDRKHWKKEKSYGGVPALGGPTIRSPEGRGRRWPETAPQTNYPEGRGRHPADTGLEGKGKRSPSASTRYDDGAKRQNFEDYGLYDTDRGGCITTAKSLRPGIFLEDGSEKQGPPRDPRFVEEDPPAATNADDQPRYYDRDMLKHNRKRHSGSYREEERSKSVGEGSPIYDRDAAKHNPRRFVRRGHPQNIPDHWKGSSSTIQGSRGSGNEVRMASPSLTEVMVPSHRHSGVQTERNLSPSVGTDPMLPAAVGKRAKRWLSDSSLPIPRQSVASVKNSGAFSAEKVDASTWKRSPVCPPHEFMIPLATEAIVSDGALEMVPKYLHPYPLSLQVHPNPDVLNNNRSSFLSKTCDIGKGNAGSERNVGLIFSCSGTQQPNGFQPVFDRLFCSKSEEMALIGNEKSVFTYDSHIGGGAFQSHQGQKRSFRRKNRSEDFAEGRKAGRQRNRKSDKDSGIHSATMSCTVAIANSPQLVRFPKAPRPDSRAQPVFTRSGIQPARTQQVGSITSRQSVLGYQSIESGLSPTLVSYHPESQYYSAPCEQIEQKHPYMRQRESLQLAAGCDQPCGPVCGRFAPAVHFPKALCPAWRWKSAKKSEYEEIPSASPRNSRRNLHMFKRAKGSVLLNEVFKHLDLIESDYFGLQYSDAENTHCMRWLDPEKSLKKQLLSSSSRPSSPFSPIPLLNNQCSLPLPVFLLRLRVKFYVSDPAKLQDEYTRYLLFLQIQHDIMENRLVVPTPIARLLASYVVQAELGDYNVEDFGQDHSYLSGLRMLPSQSVEDEAQIAEFHRRHRGQSPAMAEMNYLEAARRLEMYGVDLHQGRDAKGKDIQIGVTGGGLVVFHHRIRVNTFSWAKIIKLSFKRRHFLVTLKREASESYDTILVFDLMTYRSCKSLWKSCVEHHTFFRLPSAPARSTKRSPFPLLGSKFRYSGRTELQTIAEGRKRASERHFSRQSTARLLNRNSVPSLPPPSSSPLVAPPPTSNGSSHTHPSPPSHPSSPAPPSPESATTTPVASPPPSPSSSSASALEESVRSLPSSPSIGLPVSFSSPSSPASLQSPLHCPTSPSQISALPDDAQLTDDQRQPEDTTTKDGSTQPNDLSAPVSTSTTDVQETEVASEETEVTSVRASSETDEDLTPRVQPLTQETLTSMTQETLTSSSTATEGEEPSPLPSTEDLMPPPPPSTLKSIPLIQQLCGLSNGCGESKGGLANGGLSVISGSTAMSGNSGIGLSSPSTRASSSSSCSPNKKPPPAVPPRDANATELPTSPRRQDASAPVSSPRCMSHEGSNVDEVSG
ncbi:unnamed protein product [Cyprideis torosa]|uniref:Uncharacterized protein n=1 Tax=Cyprideis torosa TaxID=163714 RepID=A0A7R8W6L9_9CRUS|nr:unnamed protein product [Cyprideis torosa]CAG0881473.1 unnamed protein product [Cyprideis torosa]